MSLQALGDNTDGTNRSRVSQQQAGAYELQVLVQYDTSVAAGVVQEAVALHLAQHTRVDMLTGAWSQRHIPKLHVTAARGSCVQTPRRDVIVIAAGKEVGSFAI
mmetsp:Transcript_3424/g.9890  ORF Transcript_3424/g.9890 Transcript_3424/m.9890 type:complete len:104 (+) Transcript_3424:114-425(+)